MTDHHHAADAHAHEDGHGHEHGETGGMSSEHRHLLLGVAMVEGVTYAILVYLAASLAAWPIDFRPSIGAGELPAINSAVWPLLAIFVFARVHKGLQQAVCKHGSKPEGWLVFVDVVSSIAPGIALVAALIVDMIDRPASGYNWWALSYLLFIALMVGDSVWADLQALRRYQE